MNKIIYSSAIRSLTALVLLFGTSYALKAEISIGPNTIWQGTHIKIANPHVGLDIPAIITGITDASSSKRYILDFGPGVYDLGTDRIIMKPM